MTIKTSSNKPQQAIRVIRSAPDGSLRSIRVTSPVLESKGAKPSADWTKATCDWTKATCDWTKATCDWTKATC